MKIERLILFTASFPYGKIEQFLETEIKFLSKHFSKINIIPYSYGKSNEKRSLPKNVESTLPIMGINNAQILFTEIFNLAPIFFIIKEIIKKNAYKDLNCFMEYILVGIRARKVISSHQVRNILLDNLNSLIIYFYWGNISTAIIPFLKKYNIPIVARFHGGDLYEHLHEEHCGFPFREEILQALTYAILISEHGKKYLQQRYNNLNCKSKIFRLGVIDKGISTQSSDNILRIISCSNIIRIKRLDLVIDALSKINFFVEWTHIGEGDLKEKIIKEASILPANIKANFKGYMKNEELREYYSRNHLDLFLNVSESEGVPVSIMEALSAGIPVFATNAGGTSELIDDRIGKLLPIDLTADKLSKEIENYFYQPEIEKLKLRENARKRWNELANAEKVYSSFVEFLTGINDY